MIEAFVDGVGEGFEDGLLLEGEADEGDEVGEAAGLGVAFDFVRGGSGKGVPEVVLGPCGMLFAELGFQFLEHGFGEALGVGTAIEDLEGGDFGLMLLDVVAEGLGEGGGLVPGGGAEALFDDFIDDGSGDGLFALLFHLGEEVAEGGVVEWGAGGGDEGCLSFDESFLAEFLGLGSFDAGGVFCDCVGIEGLQQSGGHLAEGMAAAGGGDFLLLGGGEFAVESGEATGEGGEGVFVTFSEGDAEHEGGEGDGGLAFERAGLGLVAFADADGIDDDEVGFGAGVGTGDGLEIGGGEHAGAAAFHLFEVDAAADIAEEEEALEGFDVGACGDHVDGDGDAELRGGAEFGDEVLTFGGFAGGGVLGLVGDFLAEVGAFGEDLPDEVDDVFGVAVVFGEDEGFGDEGAAGEEVGEEGVFECGEDGADLGRDDDAAVEFFGGEGEVIVEPFPAEAACFFVAAVDVEALFHVVAGLGDAGSDAIDLVTDIDAIGDGAFVAVFHDEVLIEEADGLL